MAKTTVNDTTKAAVLKLLKRGLVTQSEAARLVGTSRQLVRHWCRDIPDARPEYLAKIWERALIRARSE